MTGTQHTEQKAPQTSRTAQWMRVARVTALVMAAWSVALQAFAGVVIPPVLVIGLIFLVFSFFLSGERRRLGLAYSIVTVIVFVGNVPVIVDDLVRIDSAPTFIVTLVSVLAAAAAFVAGLGAFFGWSEAPIRGLAAGAMVILVIGSATSLAASANAPSDAAVDGDAIVIAQQLEFNPDALVVENTTAGVWIDNKDGIYHTFTIEALEIDVEIPALKSRRVEFTASPGTYEYVCTIAGHESMTGTLVVES